LKKFKHLYKTAVEKNPVPVVQTKESEVKTVYVSDEDSVGEPLLQTTIKKVNIDEKREPEGIFEIKVTLEKKTDDKVVDKKERNYQRSR